MDSRTLADWLTDWPSDCGTVRGTTDWLLAVGFAHSFATLPFLPLPHRFHTASALLSTSPVLVTITTSFLSSLRQPYPQRPLVRVSSSACFFFFWRLQFGCRHPPASLPYFSTCRSSPISLLYSFGPCRTLSLPLQTRIRILAATTTAIAKLLTVFPHPGALDPRITAAIRSPVQLRDCGVARVLLPTDVAVRAHPITS